ncbi:drug resistance transporter, EmrB/QacA subfamily [Dehalogenimonas lykanthroporepellens BL-DC-9]|nr:drug resistance transporter, EmrB/QacA subfamily [Dehalogenimonas lykanthroporepellens BL-DC-9]
MSPNPKTALVMLGVMLTLMLSSLDQTIVATAMPRIVQEFQGLSHLSWVFTAYMLASAVTVPIYGKLTDIFGRRNLFLLAVVIFLIGSMLSGVAQSMTQLILFRGLQGIGGGAIMVNSFAIVGDLFPPAQRGKYQGLLGAVSGVTAIAGPLLGGWLSDAFSWRWIFYVNIPVGLAALGVMAAALPKHLPTHASGNRSIDYIGAALITLTLVPLLLALVWGGSEYSWGSGTIIGLLSVAVVSLVLFIWRELRAKDPILSMGLFRNRVFTVSIIAVFFSGLGMFGSILFIPVFAQGVIGVSATNSGLILMPMSLAMVTASIISGQLVSRTGNYKILAVFGMALATFGMALFSQIGPATTSGGLVLRMIITGLGLGVTMPIFTLAVQNAFDHSRLGEVTAGTQLFRSVGGTVGVAVLGGVMNAGLASRLTDISADPFVQAVREISPTTPVTIDGNTIQAFLTPDGQAEILGMLSQAPPAVQDQLTSAFHSFVETLKTAYSASIDQVFIVGAILLGLGTLTTIFLPQLPLRQTNHQPAAEEAGITLDLEFGQSDKKHQPSL